MKTKLINALLITMLTAMFATAFPVMAGATNFTSDDFNPCGPLPVWEPITSTGQTVSNNDTQLLLSVPAGSSQTIWADGTGPLQYNVVRAMQPFVGSGATDDFEIEVKFDSLVSQHYQQQGIVIEQDTGNVMRIEFHGGVNVTNVYYARFATENSIAYNKGDKLVNIGDTSAASSLSLRVNRTGSAWKLSYRIADGPWVDFGAFNYAINVTKVGVYAGATETNGQPAPAFTAAVDYFQNSAAPITAEDSGSNTLTIQVLGLGTVGLNPDVPQNGYTCGQVVELTANPESGSAFLRWEGDLSGVQNPASVIMDGSAKTITAVFSQASFEASNWLFLPAVSRID